MDLRNRIIDDVLQRLFALSDDVRKQVEAALTIELNRYEIQERCTDLLIIDDSPERLLKRFIACKRIEGAADSTLKRYWEINSEMLRFLRKPVNEISTYDLRYYLSVRREAGRVSNRTLDGMRRCYSSFFSWLSAEGLIDRNPCAALKQIKYKKTVKKAFSATELERIRENCASVRDLALIDFLYATGVRVSECANLNRNDVNFQTGEIIVLGKGNKERTVYLSDVSAMHLKDYLHTRKDANPALFIGRAAKRLTKAGIERCVKSIGERAGVNNVHPHRFRRTLATALLNRGMDIVSVSAILGHADLRTTQIYCSMSDRNVKYNYQKLLAA